ncbi:hypothetical protein BH23ACT9_BH23ACT9_13500 [soil metagenome]
MRDAQMVDPGAEQALAEVLGATPEQAEDLVRALSDVGLLTHGVLVVAGVGAARWGVELTDAVAALVQGRALPEAISAYELRTAGEEAEADLQDLWSDATRRGVGDDPAWRRLRTSDPTDGEALGTGITSAAPPVRSAVHIDARAVLTS